VKPALRSRLTPNAAASTASRSNVRDDRDTPLFRGGTAVDIEVIWVRTEQEYFCKGGWTGGLQNSLSGKSADLSPMARRAKAEGVARIAVVGE